MWKRKQDNKKKKHSKGTSIFPMKLEQLKKVLNDEFRNDPDLKFTQYSISNSRVAIFYIDYQIDQDLFQKDLLKPLLNFEERQQRSTINNLMNYLPLSSGSTTDILENIVGKLIISEVFIYIEGDKAILSYLFPVKESRTLEKAETESIVLGPQISFTESLEKNINIVRWRIKSTDLVL